MSEINEYDFHPKNLISWLMIVLSEFLLGKAKNRFCEKQLLQLLESVRYFEFKEIDIDSS